MSKWCFFVPFEELDSLPEAFRDALHLRISLDQVRLNKNDDEGWLLTASHLGTPFRVLCRYQFIGDNAENILWCEGVKKSVISFFDKKLPPPPVLIAAISEVLKNDLHAKDVETLVE